MDQRAAFRDTLEDLKAAGMEDCEVEQEGCDFSHFVDMYQRIVEADKVKPFSEAKLGRWLGWMQGAASATDFFSLAKAKEINERNKFDCGDEGTSLHVEMFLKDVPGNSIVEKAMNAGAFWKENHR